MPSSELAWTRPVGDQQWLALLHPLCPFQRALSLCRLAWEMKTAGQGQCIQCKRKLSCHAEVCCQSCPGSVCCWVCASPQLVCLAITLSINCQSSSARVHKVSIKCLLISLMLIVNVQIMQVQCLCRLQVRGAAASRQPTAIGLHTHSTHTR